MSTLLATGYSSIAIGELPLLINVSNGTSSGARNLKIVIHVGQGELRIRLADTMYKTVTVSGRS